MNECVCERPSLRSSQKQSEIIACDFLFRRQSNRMILFKRKYVQTTISKKEGKTTNEFDLWKVQANERQTAFVLWFACE